MSDRTRQLAEQLVDDIAAAGDWEIAARLFMQSGGKVDAVGSCRAAIVDWLETFLGIRRGRAKSPATAFSAPPPRGSGVQSRRKALQRECKAVPKEVATP